jgi:hypothetical protein
VFLVHSVPERLVLQLPVQVSHLLLLVVFRRQQVPSVSGSLQYLLRQS